MLVCIDSKDAFNLFAALLNVVYVSVNAAACFSCSDCYSSKSKPNVESFKSEFPA